MQIKASARSDECATARADNLADATAREIERIARELLRRGAEK